MTQLRPEIKNLNELQGEKIYATHSLFGKSSGSGFTYNTDSTTIEKKQPLGASKHNWFKFGKDDNIPNYLRELARRSGIHKSILRSKSNLVKGDGFEFFIPDEQCVVDENGFYTLNEISLSDTEKERLIKEADLWAKNVLLQKLHAAASEMMCTYGAFFVEEFYALNGDVQPFLRRFLAGSPVSYRLGTRMDWVGNDFMPDRIYISDDFTNANPHKYRQYDQFKSGDRPYGKGNLTYIPVFKNEMLNERSPFVAGSYIRNMTEYRDYYGTPDYESKSALNYIGVDYDLSNRDAKGAESDFTADIIIVRYRKQKEDPKAEKEAREKDLERLKGSYGHSAGQKSMVVYANPHTSDNGTVQTPEPIKIIQIPHDNSPERYDVARKARTEALLNAHGIIAPELVAMPNERGSGFSSQSEYLMAAMKLLFFNHIKPIQRMIEGYINDKLIQEGMQVQVRTKQSAFSFKEMSESLMLATMGKDRILGEFGRDAMSEEDRIELGIATVEQINNEDNV